MPCIHSTPSEQSKNGYITPQYHLTVDKQFTTVDDDIITDKYKQKLLNLINCNSNTHQTQTKKLNRNLISFEQDWNMIAPIINDKTSSVDGITQLPTSHDNAP